MWSRNAAGRSAKDRRMTGLRRAASGISALEEYALKDSFLARIHPAAKIMAAAVYIVCVVSFPADGAGGIAAFVLYPAILLGLSNIPAGKLVKHLIPVLPFAFMGGIANLIFMREPFFTLGSLVISTGLVSFAVIMFKAVLCTSAVLILAGCTPFHIICAQLRRFHVPVVFCTQLALMYRYISTLLEEASLMHTSYTLRSSFKNIRMKDMGAFLGGLAIRSMDRAARIYRAMKCRGWTGEFYAPPQKGAAAGFFYFFFVSGLCAAFRFINIPLLLGNLFHA
jgi:cobalt/nickel transport system permease protein